MKVLRVYHSGVVASWRRREAELRRHGAEVVLVSAVAWSEGGNVVDLGTADDADIVPARTWGHHPYVFVYDPRPIWRALRRSRFDVLDIHEEPASLATAEVLLLNWLARGPRPLVCLFSAQNIEKRYPPPFRWLEKIALRRARAIHTCNEESGRILRRKGFEGVIADLGLGVDVARFGPALEPRPQAPQTLRIGYVGRLEPFKGVDVLIEAVALVPGSELLVVGDGPEHAALARHVAERGLAARVRFRGYAPLEELPGLYRSLDALVVPSIETPAWVEQFGRVAVEAMASGVPVVASDSGALPEVLDGAGLLVPPGDPVALAEALARLRDAPGERERLAQAGLNRARYFSWSAVAERQLALYDEMVS